MYIPFKSDKYEIKLCHWYRPGLNIYITRTFTQAKIAMVTTRKKKQCKLTQLVIRLARPLYNSNRNSTADNWFSLVEFVSSFLNVYWKINEHPCECLLTKDRKLGEPVYKFVKNVTIISYIPTKNQTVVALQTVHRFKEIDIEAGKSKIIALYNLTKDGMDAFEKRIKLSRNDRTGR